jgi:hypothetical protein
MVERKEEQEKEEDGIFVIRPMGIFLICAQKFVSF